MSEFSMTCLLSIGIYPVVTLTLAFLIVVGLIALSINQLIEVRIYKLQSDFILHSNGNNPLAKIRNKEK